MALEDRVKQLEDELKVLKNEIQTTLLDIQEQVLSHYYPALYSSLNNEASSQSRPFTNAPLPEEPQTQITTSPNGIHSKYKTKTITLVEDLEEDDDGECSQEPKEPIEPAHLQVVPSFMPKQVAKSSSNNGNDCTAKPLAEKISPQNPNSSNKNGAFLDNKFAEENYQFLDALLEANADGYEGEEVSFEEFSELLPKKVENPDFASEALTGEMLDELFSETLPFLLENNRDEAQPVANSLNDQAVKLTVKKLLSWVDESVTLIGKAQTKQAVDMYVKADDLSPEMRDVLIVLIDSNNAPSPSEHANIKQIIDTLSKLNDILDHHTPEYLLKIINFIMEVNFG